MNNINSNYPKNKVTLSEYLNGLAVKHHADLESCTKMQSRVHLFSNPHVDYFPIQIGSTIPTQFLMRIDHKKNLVTLIFCQTNPITRTKIIHKPGEDGRLISAPYQNIFFEIKHKHSSLNMEEFFTVIKDASKCETTLFTQIISAYLTGSPATEHPLDEHSLFQKHTTFATEEKLFYTALHYEVFKYCNENHSEMSTQERNDLIKKKFSQLKTELRLNFPNLDIEDLLRFARKHTSDYETFERILKKRPQDLPVSFLENVTFQADPLLCNQLTKTNNTTLNLLPSTETHQNYPPITSLDAVTIYKRDDPKDVRLENSKRISTSITNFSNQIPLFFRNRHYINLYRLNELLRSLTTLCKQEATNLSSDHVSKVIDILNSILLEIFNNKNNITTTDDREIFFNIVSESHSLAIILNLIPTDSNEHLYISYLLQGIYLAAEDTLFRNNLSKAGFHLPDPAFPWLFDALANFDASIKNQEIETYLKNHFKGDDFTLFLPELQDGKLPQPYQEFLINLVDNNPLNYRNLYRPENPHQQALHILHTNNLLNTNLQGYRSLQLAYETIYHRIRMSPAYNCGSVSSTQHVRQIQSIQPSGKRRLLPLIEESGDYFLDLESMYDTHNNCFTENFSYLSSFNYKIIKEEYEDENEDTLNRYTSNIRYKVIKTPDGLTTAVPLDMCQVNEKGEAIVLNGTLIFKPEYLDRNGALSLYPFELDENKKVKINKHRDPVYRKHLGCLGLNHTEYYYEPKIERQSDLNNRFTLTPDHIGSHFKTAAAAKKTNRSDNLIKIADNLIFNELYQYFKNPYKMSHDETIATLEGIEAFLSSYQKHSTFREQLIVTGSLILANRIAKEDPENKLDNFSLSYNWLVDLFKNSSFTSENPEEHLLYDLIFSSVEPDFTIERSGDSFQTGSLFLPFTNEFALILSLSHELSTYLNTLLSDKQGPYNNYIKSLNLKFSEIPQQKKYALLLHSHTAFPRGASLLQKITILSSLLAKESTDPDTDHSDTRNNLPNHRKYDEMIYTLTSTPAGSEWKKSDDENDPAKDIDDIPKSKHQYLINTDSQIVKSKSSTYTSKTISGKFGNEPDYFFRQSLYIASSSKDKTKQLFAINPLNTVQEITTFLAKNSMQPLYSDFIRDITQLINMPGRVWGACKLNKHLPQRIYSNLYEALEACMVTKEYRNFISILNFGGIVHKHLNYYKLDTHSYIITDYLKKTIYHFLKIQGTERSLIVQCYRQLAVYEQFKYTNFHMYNNDEIADFIVGILAGRMQTFDEFYESDKTQQTILDDLYLKHSNEIRNLMNINQNISDKIGNILYSITSGAPYIEKNARVAPTNTQDLYKLLIVNPEIVSTSFSLTNPIPRNSKISYKINTTAEFTEAFRLISHYTGDHYALNDHRIRATNENEIEIQSNAGTFTIQGNTLSLSSYSDTYTYIGTIGSDSNPFRCQQYSAQINSFFKSFPNYRGFHVFRNQHNQYFLNKDRDKAFIFFGTKKTNSLQIDLSNLDTCILDNNLDACQRFQKIASNDPLKLFLNQFRSVAAALNSPIELAKYGFRFPGLPEEVSSLDLFAILEWVTYSVVLNITNFPPPPILQEYEAFINFLSLLLSQGQDRRAPFVSFLKKLIENIPNLPKPLQNIEDPVSYEHIFLHSNQEVPSISIPNLNLSFNIKEQDGMSSFISNDFSGYQLSSQSPPQLLPASIQEQCIVLENPIEKTFKVLVHKDLTNSILQEGSLVSDYIQLNFDSNKSPKPKDPTEQFFLLLLLQSYGGSIGDISTHLQHQTTPYTKDQLLLLDQLIIIYLIRTQIHLLSKNQTSNRLEDTANLIKLYNHRLIVHQVSGKKDHFSIDFNLKDLLKDLPIDQKSRDLLLDIGVDILFIPAYCTFIQDQNNLETFQLSKEEELMIWKNIFEKIKQCALKYIPNKVPPFLKDSSEYVLQNIHPNIVTDFIDWIPLVTSAPTGVDLSWFTPYLKTFFERASFLEKGSARISNPSVSTLANSHPEDHLNIPQPLLNLNKDLSDVQVIIKSLNSTHEETFTTPFTEIEIWSDFPNFWYLYERIRVGTDLERDQIRKSLICSKPLLDTKRNPLRDVNSKYIYSILDSMLSSKKSTFPSLKEIKDQLKIVEELKRKAQQTPADKENLIFHEKKLKKLLSPLTLIIQVKHSISKFLSFIFRNMQSTSIILRLFESDLLKKYLFSTTKDLPSVSYQVASRIIFKNRIHIDEAAIETIDSKFDIHQKTLQTTLLTDISTGKTNLKEFISEQKANQQVLQNAVLEYANARDSYDDLVPVNRKVTYLDLDQIQKLFVNGDLDQFRKLTSLSKNKIDLLTNTFAQYLAYKSRINYLEQILTELDLLPKSYTEEDIFTITQKLQAKRNYKVSYERRETLAFEATRSMMLREIQDNLINKIIDELKTSNSVIAKIGVGSGKTDVMADLINRLLIEQSSSFDRKVLLINSYPESLVITNTTDAAINRRQLDNSHVMYLNFSDRDAPLETLENKYHLLQQSLKNGTPITTSPEDLKSLRLQFINACLDSRVNYVDCLRKICCLLKVHGIIHFDESVEATHPNYKTQYTSGIPHSVMLQETILIEFFFDMLLENPIAKQRLQEQQLYLYRENDEERMALFIEIFNRFIKLRQYTDPAFIEELRNFVFYDNDNDEEYTIPSTIQNHSDCSTLKLLKGLLNKQGFINESIFKEKPGTDYGKSKIYKETTLYAIPAKEGVVAEGPPIVTASGKEEPNISIFANYHATIARTYGLYHFTKLNREEIYLLLKHLQDIMNNELQTIRAISQQTKELFENILNEQELNGFHLLKKSDLSLMADRKSREDDQSQLIKYFIRLCAIPQIQIYDNILSATGQNARGMSYKAIGVSGTAQDPKAFEAKGISIENSDPVQDFIDTLKRKKPEISSISSSKPQDVLQELLPILGRTQASALADGAGLLNGLKPITVIKEISDTLINKNQFIFHDGQDLTSINPTTNKGNRYDNAALPSKDRFAFFDHSHSFGTNVRLEDSIDTCGVITINEFSTIESVTQTAGRLRGFPSKQTIHIVITKSLEDRIIKTYGELNLDNLITELEDIGTKEKQHYNLESLNDQMDEELQETVMREALDVEGFRKENHFNPLKAALIIKNNSNIFSISSCSVDGYAYLGSKVSGKKAVEIHYESTLGKLANIRGSVDKDTTKRRLFEIENNKNNIDLPQHTARYASSNKGNVKVKVNVHQKTIAQSKTVDKPVSERIEKKWDYKVNVSDNTQFLKISSVAGSALHPVSRFIESFETWHSNQKKEVRMFLYPALMVTQTIDAISWIFKKVINIGYILAAIAFPAKTPSIFRAKDCLAGIHSLASASIQLPDELLVTSNIWDVNNQHGKEGWRAASIEPFGKEQKPIQELVVFETKTEEKTSYTALIVDQHETGFFQSKIASQSDPDSNIKIAVYNLNTSTFTNCSDHFNETDAAEQLKDSFIISKLLAMKELSTEELNYTQSTLQNKLGMDNFYKFIYTINNTPEKKSTLESSQLGIMLTQEAESQKNRKHLV